MPPVTATTNRHIYWFKFWRWYRGDIYVQPAVTTHYEPVDVLNFTTGASATVHKPHNMFWKWNREYKLRDIVVSIFKPQSRQRIRHVPADHWNTRQSTSKATNVLNPDFGYRVPKVEEPKPVFRVIYDPPHILLMGTSS